MNTASTGMATIRVICQQKKPLFWRLMSLSLFARKSYPVHIGVDGKDYKFDSKLGQFDISVTPGTHNLYLGNYSEKAKNNTNIAGDAFKGIGFGTGSGNTAAAGMVASLSSKVMGKDLGPITLEAGQVYELKVKLNNIQQVVVDK